MNLNRILLLFSISYSHSRSRTTSQLDTALRDSDQRKTGHTVALRATLDASMPPGQTRGREKAVQSNVDPIWWHYACATLVVGVVLGNLLRWSFLGQSSSFFFA